MTALVLILLGIFFCFALWSIACSLIAGGHYTEATVLYSRASLVYSTATLTMRTTGRIPEGYREEAAPLETEAAARKAKGKRWERRDPIGRLLTRVWGES